MNEPEPLDIEKIKIKNNIHKLTKDKNLNHLRHCSTHLILTLVVGEIEEKPYVPNFLGTAM